MPSKLQGRHALVCGASQGIGRATAIALAQAGADVTVLARNRATLDAVVKALPRPLKSQQHDWIEVDLANLSMLSVKVEASAQLRPFQILINNSAGPAPGALQTATAEQFLDTFHKHLIASHSLLQSLLPGMRSAGYGRVVNVISTSVKEPIRNLGVSNAIRGAVAAWAKTLATELGSAGITVNNVLPGYTRTRRLQQIIEDRAHASGQTQEHVVQSMLQTVPAARFAEPEEIAGAIAFLCSPAAAYINGINLPVDGGRTQSL